MAARLGVTLKTGGGSWGVRNGFCTGDGGTEGGTVGIHIEDVIDGVVKSIERGVNIKRLAHWR